VLLLFWFENVVIGIFNVLRMITVTSGGWPGQVAKLFLIPFFVIHYGMFTLAHVAFLLVLFGGQAFPGHLAHAKLTGHFSMPVSAMWHALTPAVVLAACGLVASHGISFVSNFIGRGEFRRINIGELMLKPYGRIAVLQITIILGGLLAIKTGSPQFAVALLVLLKIAMDVRAHRAERKKFASGLPTPSTMPAE